MRGREEARSVALFLVEVFKTFASHTQEARYTNRYSLKCVLTIPSLLIILFFLSRYKSIVDRTKPVRANRILPMVFGINPRGKSTVFYKGNQSEKECIIRHDKHFF